MPRKSTDTTRSSAAVSRVTGRVRVPGESDPLDVEIVISAAAVSMVSGDLDLGSWSPDEVRIKRIDPFSFTFTAEGDRLVFVPDDARAFARLPLVVAGSGSGEKARRRKWRIIRHSRSSTSSDRAPKQRRSISIPKPSIPKPRLPTFKRSAPASASARTKPATSAPPTAAPEGGSGHALWIKAVDTARENGWFGLDRVPVHLDLRGKPHDHTYEHGAAADSGPSAHICTICGNFRYKK